MELVVRHLRDGPIRKTLVAFECVDDRRQKKVGIVHVYSFLLYVLRDSRPVLPDVFLLREHIDFCNHRRVRYPKLLRLFARGQWCGSLPGYRFEVLLATASSWLF